MRLPNGEWFKLKDVARLARIDRQQLPPLIESGEIAPAIDLRANGSTRACYRVSRDALVQFMKARRIRAPRAKPNGQWRRP